MASSRRKKKRSRLACKGHLGLNKLHSIFAEIGVRTSSATGGFGVPNSYMMYVCR